MIEDSRHHHQHDQRKTDPEQADEGEELPPQEDLECGLDVVFEHNLLLVNDVSWLERKPLCRDTKSVILTFNNSL
jgi:hypothetical protein